MSKMFNQNRIQELRKQCNMRQEDLADKLQLSRQAISNYESGEREPSIDTIWDMCVLFDVTADFLLGFSNQRTFDLSDEEYALLDAFRAAEPHIQRSIKTVLEPYWEEDSTTAASSSLSAAE